MLNADGVTAQLGVWWRALGQNKTRVPYKARGGESSVVVLFGPCKGLRMPAVGNRSHTQRRPASANLYNN